MRNLLNNPNVDVSDLANYPNGRIKNNTGIGDGTPVDERTKGDWHQAVAKMMRLYNIIPNDLPDNETNGYQIVDALRALASKNDFVLPLGVTASKITLPIKLGLMLEGESVVCQSSVNFASESVIRGSDNIDFSVSVIGSFKANEYVRAIKTSTGVVLVRLSDAISLNLMVSELLYLKKASYGQEIAGVSDLVATTPQTNALAFVERVNGALSAASLANAIRNGLYPKEHFAIVAGLGASPVKNTGWFAGLDVAGTPPGTSLAFGGNITSAVTFSSGPMVAESFVLVTMQNPMANTNYFVRMHPESQATLNVDNDISGLVFRPFSTTQFQIAIKENSSSSNSIKLHMEVVQL